MHARQTILNATAVLLDAVASKPWRGVYVAAYTPPKAALPALLVHSVSEEVENFGMLDQRRQLRRMNMAIDCVMSTRPSPEDNTADLNTMTEKLETAITDAALTSAWNMALQSTEILDQPDESGMVMATVTYWIEYTTMEGVPGTIVD